MYASKELDTCAGSLLHGGKGLGRTSQASESCPPTGRAGTCRAGGHSSGREAPFHGGEGAASPASPPPRPASPPDGHCSSLNLTRRKTPATQSNQPQAAAGGVCLVLPSPDPHAPSPSPPPPFCCAYPQDAQGQASPSHHSASRRNPPPARRGEAAKRQAHLESSHPG
jgi:hypothetical protein